MKKTKNKKTHQLRDDYTGKPPQKRLIKQPGSIKLWFYNNSFELNPSSGIYNMIYDITK